MKKNLMIVFLAIVVGGIFSVVIFFRNKNEAYGLVSNNNIVNAFQIGVFNDYNNAVDLSRSYEGSIVVFDEMYRVYIAIFNNEELVDEYRAFCADNGISFYVKKIKVDDMFLNVLTSYEEDLLISEDINFFEVNGYILSEYKDVVI